MSGSFHQQVKAGFDRAATSYDEYASLQRTVARELFSRAKSHILPEHQWLDVGCGTGFLQELLRSSGHKASLVQLDIAPAMCDVASSYASDDGYGLTQTVCGDMAALPLKTGAMDGVISSLALQWSGDMNGVFAELATVLKRDGWCFASVMGEGSLVELRSSYKELGRTAPLLEFVSHEKLQAMVDPVFGGQCEIERQSITLYYENVMELLQSLKGIGASYRGKRERLASRGFFKELEEAYRVYHGDEKGIPATWNILYLSGRKV